MSPIHACADVPRAATRRAHEHRLPSCPASPPVAPRSAEAECDRLRREKAAADGALHSAQQALATAVGEAAASAAAAAQGQLAQVQAQLGQLRDQLHRETERNNELDAEKNAAEDALDRGEGRCGNSLSLSPVSGTACSALHRSRGLAWSGGTAGLRTSCVQGRDGGQCCNSSDGCPRAGLGRAC